MRRLLYCLLPAAFYLPVRADDIWDRRDPRAAFLFEDTRARRIGDLLTVAVNETTAANEKDQRAMDKSTKLTDALKFDGKSAAGKVSRAGSLDASFSNASGRTFNGSAQLTSDRTFTDRITVTVVDIMPNGNLVVEGYRSRVVAGEQRVLRVTGIVRPTDIGAQNTVQSQFMASFKISYLGRGPESKFVNQSYLGRVMNLLWPF
jgi:flagellar L-ring protein precursor FlgH